VFDGGFAINGKTKKKKGSNTYYEPVFERVTVPDAVNAEATKLDEQLQKDYLIPYFSRDEPEYTLPLETEQPELLSDEDEVVSPPKAQAAAASSEVAPNSDDDDSDIPW
jgi:hypothetical protein